MRVIALWMLGGCTVWNFARCFYWWEMHDSYEAVVCLAAGCVCAYLFTANRNMGKGR